MYFSVRRHAHYSNTSSPIRPSIGPTGVRGSTFAASFSLHKGITVTRWRELNLLPSSYDFSISGRNLPFGAGQSGIWEGKVLLWPEAQQRVSFDQWVSSGFGHMRASAWIQSGPAIFIAVSLLSHMDSSSFISCFFIWPSLCSQFMSLANIHNRHNLLFAFEEEVRKVRASVHSILSLFPTVRCFV